MQTLKLGTLENTQTGNTAELLLNEDNTWLYYKEICALGVVEGGLDHEGAYWATWTPKGEICSNAYTTEHHCLDDALSNLEVEMESVYDFPLPWRSESMGR
jgi:hypothetical protein